MNGKFISYKITIFYFSDNNRKNKLIVMILKKNQT